MTSFLFHKVSDKEKQVIKQQAKQIMDDFSKKLSAIKKKISEPIVEREKFEREEGEGKHGEDFSKEIMFENAPKKNKDFIIAERKKW